MPCFNCLLSDKHSYQNIYQYPAKNTRLIDVQTQSKWNVTQKSLVICRIAQHHLRRVTTERIDSVQFRHVYCADSAVWHFLFVFSGVPVTLLETLDFVGLCLFVCLSEFYHNGQTYRHANSTIGTGQLRVPIIPDENYNQRAIWRKRNA